MIKIYVIKKKKYNGFFISNKNFKNKNKKKNKKKKKLK